GQGVSGADYWWVGWDGSAWRFYCTNPGVNITAADATIVANTWYHVSFVREGDVWTIRRDGVTKGTATAAGTMVNRASDLSVGECIYSGSTSGLNYFFKGWIDEVSVRVGVAVWGADFTPPTAAYSSSGIIAITGVTTAATGVVTAPSHGYATGDEIYISGIAGMTELNNRWFYVTSIDTNTFSLTNIDGVVIDTSAYTAYTSGGTSDAIYEITSPYVDADLFELKFAQKADLMYVIHPDYEPRKLIRSGETSWALSTFTRTADPFTKAITGITQANPGVVTATAHGFENSDLVEIYGVVGMTEVNGNTYKVANKVANTFELTDPTTGTNINTSGYTLYSSGGYVLKQSNMPGAVAFYGGRLFYGGTLDDPETFWGSKAPTNAGVVQYDNFTVGSSAGDAVIFPISSQNNTADRIQWFAGVSRFLAIGTFGGVYKANGGSDTTPISGTAIAAPPIEFVGCKNLSPVRVGSSLYYVQRGGLVLNIFTFSLMADDYRAASLNIFSDEITKTGIIQITTQQGTSDIIWGVTTEGKLIGITVKTGEEINAWHSHELGGADVKVLSVCGEPQPDNRDSLWAVVERTIGGVTRRYIEYFAAEDPLPEPEDYYTGDRDADDTKYKALLYEAAKHLIRVDCSMTYDASQTIALTPAAVSGLTTFTAAGSLFSAADVGRYIVKKVI
ncbi:MAG: ubiquitin-activating E1 FCCH domain-containing protein, partial [Burkholderiaceae bacterium]